MERAQDFEGSLDAEDAIVSASYKSITSSASSFFILTEYADVPAGCVSI
jgi:hypothetical protein